MEIRIKTGEGMWKCGKICGKCGKKSCGEPKFRGCGKLGGKRGKVLFFRFSHLFSTGLFRKVLSCGNLPAAVCRMSHDKAVSPLISVPVSTGCPAFSSDFAGGFHPAAAFKSLKKPLHRRKILAFPVFHSLHTPYYDYYDLSIFYSVFLFLSASAAKGCRNAQSV